MDVRQRGLVIHDEVAAIEANEAFLRGGPDVTIRGLAERVNRALRQPLVDAPGANHILVEGERRIDAERAAGPNREDDEEEEPTVCQSHYAIRSVMLDLSMGAVKMKLRTIRIYRLYIIG